MSLFPIFYIINMSIDGDREIAYIGAQLELRLIQLVQPLSMLGLDCIR